MKLSEDVEIKLSEEAKYVPENKGLQLKCEGVGRVVREGLKDLSQVNPCTHCLFFIVDFFIYCRLMVVFLFRGLPHKSQYPISLSVALMLD